MDHSLGSWCLIAAPRSFGCAALDYRPARESSGDCAILVPRSGTGQQLSITLVLSDAKDHQRHHLDLYATDRAAEVERLLSLGARRVEWRYPENADDVVLADPDGNTFCVVQKVAVSCLNRRAAQEERGIRCRRPAC